MIYPHKVPVVSLTMTINHTQRWKGDEMKYPCVRGIQLIVCY